MIVIEAKTIKATLRFRKAGSGVFVVENWHKKEQVWEKMASNPDYFVAMHEFFDEVCACSPKPPSDSVGGIDDLNVG